MNDATFQAVRAAITAKVGLFDLDGVKHPSIDELTRAVVEAMRRVTLSAGRGDATQPDPAMIERAKLAAADAVSASIAADIVTERTTYESDLVEAAVEAAAAVIVPATAEHIAEAIDAAADKYPPGDEYGGIYDEAARIARAAGLSAGATGGDSE